MRYELRLVRAFVATRLTLDYGDSILGFVAAAGLAGLAGSLKVVVQGFETLSDAYWTMSGLVVLMTLVGGMGTLAGPVLGAIIIIAGAPAAAADLRPQLLLGTMFVLAPECRRLTGLDPESDEVIEAPGIPHTRTGKKLEVPVKRILLGAAPDAAAATCASPP